MDIFQAVRFLGLYQNADHPFGKNLKMGANIRGVNAKANLPPLCSGDIAHISREQFGSWLPRVVGFVCGQTANAVLFNCVTYKKQSQES